MTVTVNLPSGPVRVAPLGIGPEAEHYMRILSTCATPDPPDDADLAAALRTVAAAAMRRAGETPEAVAQALDNISLYDRTALDIMAALRGRTPDAAG